MSRYVFLGREQTFPVVDGHVVVAFDDIPFRVFCPAEADFPSQWPDLPSSGSTTTGRSDAELRECARMSLAAY
jgi:hypothetical protein